MKLKYAVIYQSLTGNTERIARTIYEAIESDMKQLIDIENLDTILEADVYFVGFNVHNDSCSIQIIDCLEQITGGYIALFCSCGYVPTDEYKLFIENKLKVWLPDDTEYMGMYMCQGRVQEEQKELMYRDRQNKKEILDRMFDIGESHPDMQDFTDAMDFSKHVQTRIETE